MLEKPDDELNKFVRQFLTELKALIYEKGLIVKDHVKNRDSLLELGLTGKQREEIVLSLSVSDYNSGPIKDEYKPGYYWVFGKQIDRFEVYIKLKIAEQPGAEHAICLSFHKAEWTLNYPFAK